MLTGRRDTRIPTTALSHSGCSAPPSPHPSAAVRVRRLIPWRRRGGAAGIRRPRRKHVPLCGSSATVFRDRSPRGSGGSGDGHGLRERQRVGHGESSAASEADREIVLATKQSIRAHDRDHFAHVRTAGTGCPGTASAPAALPCLARSAPSSGGWPPRTLGRAPHPRGTAAPGPRGLRAQRLPLPALPASHPESRADLDDLPPEPPKRHRRHGLLLGAYRHVPRPPYASRHPPRPARRGPLRRHDDTNRCLGRAAASRGLSVRLGTRVS